MFAELNKNSYQWKVNGKDFPFKKLSDFEAGDTFTIRGFFINSKGKYKPYPVAILDDVKVDLPAHLTEAVKGILDDPVKCKAVDEGHCGAEVYKYDSSQRKDCYSITFIDIQ